MRPRTAFEICHRARAPWLAMCGAVDEVGGVHRLHHLGPQLPHPSSVLEMSELEIRAFGAEAARAAKLCGINFFLAPVVDLVTGSNPWLRDRTFSIDPDIVGRVASAFIRGVQDEGLIATAKHFPGHPNVPIDPFDSETVTVTATLEELAPSLRCFDATIAAGVRAIMTGPIPVDAIDPDEPASCSPKIVGMLRGAHNFKGLVVSDDIDLPHTAGPVVPDAPLPRSRRRDLLLASGPQVDGVTRGSPIIENGELSQDVLARAAQPVRSLADGAGQRERHA